MLSLAPPVTYVAVTLGFKPGAVGSQSRLSESVSHGCSLMKSLQARGQSATVTDVFLKADDTLFGKILNQQNTFFTHTCLIGQKLPTRFAPDLIRSLLYVKPVTSTIITF